MREAKCVEEVRWVGEKLTFFAGKEFRGMTLVICVLKIIDTGNESFVDMR